MTKLNITLPESFLQEEVRDGYRVPAEMKKVWAVELDLLNEFRRVCDKYNIQWWADAGTILGAARHGGMIPWDDDIDVMLLRDDYDRLCEIAPEEFLHPYFFQTHKTDLGSFTGHAQLRNSETTGIVMVEKDQRIPYNQGIFIDIFPIDNILEDKKVLQAQTDKIAKYKSQAYSYRVWKIARPIDIKRFIKYRLKFLLTSIGWLYRGEDYPKASSMFEQEVRKYNGTQTEYIAKLVLPPFKPRRIWKREWFDETVYLPFEWMKLPVPGGYVELLDTFYGDWKKFVIGTSTHGSVLFDTEKSYKEYI